MTKKEILEAGLILGGSVLGAVGAALIEPAVIGLGVVAAGTAAVMRFTDRRSVAHRAANDASVAHK